MAQKTRKGEAVPRDVGAFNWGVKRIFEDRKIPLDKDASWLVRWRSTSRVASAYLLALDYCREALGSNDRNVVAAAREKGNLISGKAEELLSHPEATKMRSREKLEAARDAYLDARGRGAVPARKGREPRGKVVPKKQEPKRELEGTKIRRASGDEKAVGEAEGKGQKKPKSGELSIEAKKAKIYAHVEELQGMLAEEYELAEQACDSINALFDGKMSGEIVDAGDQKTKKQLDAYLLGQLRNPVVSGWIISALHNTKKAWWLREGKAMLLGRIAPDNKELIKRMLEQLEHEKHPKVKRAIADALLRIAKVHGNPELVGRKEELAGMRNPTKEELEADIREIKEGIWKAEQEYDSLSIERDMELEKMVDEESSGLFGLFTSREDVLVSGEYKKLKNEWGKKVDTAEQEWLETRDAGNRKIAALEDKIESLYWTQEQRMKKVWEYAKETLDPKIAGRTWRGMVSRLRGLAAGGMSRSIVGCKSREEREELDGFLLSILEDGAKNLSSHEGLSNRYMPIRHESAEAIGIIAPNDEWVNLRLANQLRKYEKRDLVKGEIALAVGRIAEKHKDAKIHDGGKLRDEATDILLGILAEGERPASDNEFDINFRRRMFVKSLIALGKTAKGTKKEREAIDALAKAAVESPTPLASIAAAASIAEIGGKYAKKKLEDVRGKMGLPEASRLVEISDAYENRTMETGHLGREVEAGIMGADADFSRLVPPGKPRRKMVFGAPYKK